MIMRLLSKSISLQMSFTKGTYEILPLAVFTVSKSVPPLFDNPTTTAIFLLFTKTSIPTKSLVRNSSSSRSSFHWSSSTNRAQPLNSISSSIEFMSSNFIIAHLLLNFTDKILAQLGEIITPELITGLLGVGMMIIIFLVFFDDDFDALH